MSRRVSNGSNGRAQAQRIVSGARVNPYSRPESASKKVADGSKQWPPNQLSIRGSSGPTWIIVSNLLRGTSEADIQSTFQQFGSIEAVRSHQTATTTGKSDNSLSFEIAFTHATSAQGAIDKLNGALADGRVLSVRQRDNVPVQPAAMASGSKQPPRAPAAMTAAAAQQHANIGKKELLPAKKAPSLNSRILSATELKTLSKKQAKAKKAVGTLNGMLTAPGLNQVSPASASLANRIGSLPLALRLAEGNGTGKGGNKKGGLIGNAASATTPASSAQKKRKRAKAKAAAAAKSGSGMQLD